MAKIKIKLNEEQRQEVVRHSKPRLVRGMSGAGAHGNTKYSRTAQKKRDRLEMRGF